MLSSAPSLKNRNIMNPHLLEDQTRKITICLLTFIPIFQLHPNMNYYLNLLITE